MKRVLAILLSLVLVLSLAACGKDKSSEPSNSEKTTQEQKNNDAKKRVGVSMPTQSGERWIKDGGNMKQKLEAQGYEVDLQFGEDHIENQVAQIENMITKGVDVLIVAPIDGFALSEVLKKAKEAGAVVISYDRLLQQTPDVDYYATFDSIEIGKLQGGYIVEKLGVKEGKGPFNVELFAGSLDDNNTAMYYEGAMMELQPYIDSGKIVIKSGQTGVDTVATLRWDGAVAQARMDNILTAHYSDGSKVDAVLSPYDGLSIGILSSLKAVGYGKSADLPFPIITGQDAEVASVKSIIAGEQTQTVFVDTRALADVAVKLALQALKGEEVEVNKPDTYDNGVKKVPAMAINAVSVDLSNYKEVVIDSGYITEDQLK